MRCPVCRCEVGSQKRCPYCGAPMKMPEQRQPSEMDYLNKIYRYIRGIDSTSKDQNHKLNVLLVLVCGNLALTLLVLIALLIQ